MKFMTISVTTFLGIGFLPLMPGTFASFASLLLHYFFLKNAPFYIPIFLILFVFLAGTIFSGRAEEIFKEKDPRSVVIDEVFGQMVSFFLISSRFTPLLIGFILFRFFDVVKPFPCFEVQKLRGGWGIMLDDFFAGVWANIFLRIIMIIMKV